MEDTALLIRQYEILRDVCIVLDEIAERHPELNQFHDELLEYKDALLRQSHDILVKKAYELKKEQSDEEKN